MAEQLRVSVVSDDEVEAEIGELYWSQDSEGAFVHGVREIAETFGLSEYEVREVARAAVVVESTEVSCLECGAPHTFTSRSQAAQGIVWQRNRYVCDGCKATRIQEQARARDEEQRAKRLKIETRYVVPDDRMTYAPSLDLASAVGLLALVRTSGQENAGRIDPLIGAAQRLAPGREHLYEVLGGLYRQGLVYVDPNSSLDAFVWEDGEPESFYLDEVSWCPPGPPGGLGRISVDLGSLLPSERRPDRWALEAPSFQCLLAAHEMSDYLIERFDEHHFRFSPGEKTWDLLSAMAERLSIGQGCNLIWRSAKDAASFLVREGCEPSRAAAYGIGALRRSFERAITDGWEIKPYKRSWGIAESEMVHLFYRIYLDSEDPMNQPPVNPIPPFRHQPVEVG